MKIKQTFKLALKASIVKRGIKYAVVVGTILVLINHSDRLVEGKITALQGLQIALTYAVPYIVSSLSSVQALIAKEKESNA